jgi:hypothetical protein
MQPIIKPSIELRKNYNGITETYHENNGEAERLSAAERARMEGAKGYTVNEFRNNMQAAIKAGAKSHGAYCPQIAHITSTSTEIFAAC